MSVSDSHRWPVKARNTATGAARTWVRMPWFIHFAWVMAMVLYTFIGFTVDPSPVRFAAWEIIFGLLWVAALSFFARVFGIT